MIYNASEYISISLRVTLIMGTTLIATTVTASKRTALETYIVAFVRYSAF